MKHIIFFFFISTTVFAQTPRLKFRQIQKDTTQGSIAISNPADSQLVFSRDFYISYGVDTVLILYGDTIGVGGTLDAEQVQDIVGAMVNAGLGLDVTYNDVDGELLLESLSIEDSVKNETLSTITKGTPLYAVTTVGNYWSVEPADATDPNKMPVVAIAGEDLIAGATGIGLILGHIKGVNVPTSWSAGDEVWVGANGTFINHEPATEDTLVQKLGSVIKTGTNGSGIISIGDVNKNLNDGNIFIGDATGKVTTTQYIVDSTRINATGDTAYYYQNGVLIGTQAIAGGGGGTSYNNISETADTVFITGDLDVDANTLRVDATNNMVGINTATPNTESVLAGDLFIKSVRGGYDAGLYIRKGVAGNGAVYKNIFIGEGFSSDASNIDNNVTMGMVQLTNADSNYANFNFFDKDYNNVGGFGMRYLSHTSNLTDFYIATANGGTGTTKMTIKGNGNVGIGTSSPTLATLQINSLDGSNINGLRIDKGTANDTTSGFKNLFIGTGYASDPNNIDNNITMGLFQKKNRNNNYANFNFFNYNGSNVGGFGMRYINHTGRISDFYIATANGSSPTTKMTIKGNGEVWIGYTTDNGNYKLQVNGQIFATSSTIATSDIKYKDNIQSISESLPFLMKLNPVTYDFKQDPVHNFPTETQVGLIAQEVESVFSGSTYLNSIVYENNGYKGLAYDKLIPITVKAIQEQQVQIETLKTELDAKSLIIETQQSEINQLKTLITDLTNRLTILENK